MLVSKHPDTLKFGKWLDNFSEHKRHPKYSIGEEERWKETPNAKDPGPGHYRVDRDLPVNNDEEYSGRVNTRVAPSYTMPYDHRENADGVLKGIWQPSSSKLGPGQYKQIALGTRSKEKRFITHQFPRSIESAEALRERKKQSDNPGPGVYSLVRQFDDNGREKDRVTERAVRKGTGCWASSQYTHIFSCMKPKDGRASLPALMPSSGGAGGSTKRAASNAGDPVDGSAMG